MPGVASPAAVRCADGRRWLRCVLCRHSALPELLAAAASHLRRGSAHQALGSGLSADRTPRLCLHPAFILCAMRCMGGLACSLLLLLAASCRGAGERTRHTSAHSSDPRDSAHRNAAISWMGEWGDDVGGAAWVRGGTQGAGQNTWDQPGEAAILGSRFRVWEDASAAPHFMVRRWMHDEPWERPRAGAAVVDCLALDSIKRCV